MDSAPQFPWWRTGVISLGEDAGITAGPRYAFAPGGVPGVPEQTREPWIPNDQPKPVAIQEVRFWSNQPFYSIDQGVAYEGDFLDPMLVQMESDLHQGIVKEWIPVKSLRTVVDHCVFGHQGDCWFKLPAPFYLQAQQQFRIHIRVRTDVLGFGAICGSDVYIHLHGKDPFTGSPTSYCKLITLPPINPATGLPLDIGLDYNFDEDRDAPIRDMVLTDISFAAKTIEALPNWQLLDGLEVKFMPPTGPDWTKDRLTHLYQGLSEQQGGLLGFLGGLAARYPVIFRPKRPFILRPGDHFRVEATFQGNTLPKKSYVQGQNLIFCRVSGVQEGTNA
jgi:hypothetical protein